MVRREGGRLNLRGREGRIIIIWEREGRGGEAIFFSLPFNIKLKREGVGHIQLYTHLSLMCKDE